MWAVLRWCKVRACVCVGVCVNCEATGAYFRTWQISGTYASVIIIPAEFKNSGPKIIKPIDYNFHSSLINVEPPASFVWCAKPTCWVMARRGLLAECSNCLESELAAPRPQSCRNRSKSLPLGGLCFWSDAGQLWTPLWTTSTSFLPMADRHEREDVPAGVGACTANQCLIYLWSTQFQFPQFLLLSTILPFQFNSNFFRVKVTIF